LSQIVHKIKDLSTLYIYILIFGTAMFNLYIDSKQLKKKNLKREEKISRIIGYGYLIVGGAFLILANFIL